MLENETPLLTLIHGERELRRASDEHDLGAVAIAGSYLQGWQDALNTLVGEAQTKRLFRCARRVVEQDVHFEAVNKG